MSVFIDQLNTKLVKIINGLYITLSLITFPIAIAILLFGNYNILFAVLSIVPWIATSIYIVFAMYHYKISNQDLAILKESKVNAYVMSFVAVILGFFVQPITNLIFGDPVSITAKSILLYSITGIIFGISNYFLGKKFPKVKKQKAN